MEPVVYQDGWFHVPIKRGAPDVNIDVSVLPPLGQLLKEKFDACTNRHYPPVVKRVQRKPCVEVPAPLLEDSRKAALLKALERGGDVAIESESYDSDQSRIIKFKVYSERFIPKLSDCWGQKEKLVKLIESCKVQHVISAPCSDKHGSATFVKINLESNS